MRRLWKSFPEKGGRFLRNGAYKEKVFHVKCKSEGLPYMAIIGGCPMGLLRISVKLL